MTIINGSQNLCQYTEQPCLDPSQTCRCNNCQDHARRYVSHEPNSDLLSEILKICSGEMQVDDGEDAEDALKWIERLIRKQKGEV